MPFYYTLEGLEGQHSPRGRDGGEKGDVARKTRAETGNGHEAARATAHTSTREREKYHAVVLCALVGRDIGARRSGARGCSCG